MFLEAFPNNSASVFFLIRMSCNVVLYSNLTPQDKRKHLLLKTELFIFPIKWSEQDCCCFVVSS